MMNIPPSHSAELVTTAEELDALEEALGEEATGKLMDLDPESVIRRLEEEISFAEHEEDPWLTEEAAYSPRVAEMRESRNIGLLVSDSIRHLPLTLPQKREAFHIALSRFILLRAIQFTRSRLKKAAKQADSGAVYEQIEATFTRDNRPNALLIAKRFRGDILGAHPNIPKAAGNNLMRTIGHVKSLLADLHEVRIQEQELKQNS